MASKKTLLICGTYTFGAFLTTTALFPPGAPPRPVSGPALAAASQATALDTPVLALSPLQQKMLDGDGPLASAAEALRGSLVNAIKQGIKPCWRLQHGPPVSVLVDASLVVQGGAAALGPVTIARPTDPHLGDDTLECVSFYVRHLGGRRLNAGGASLEHSALANYRGTERVTVSRPDPCPSQ